MLSVHIGVIVVFERSILSLIIVEDPPPSEDANDCGGISFPGVLTPSEDAFSSSIGVSNGVVSRCSRFAIPSSALLAEYGAVGENGVFF